MHRFIQRALLAILAVSMAVPAFAQDIISLGVAGNPGPQIAARGGYEGVGAVRKVTLPAAMAPYIAGLTLGTLSLSEDPERTVGVMSRTPQAIYGDYSTALSAPDHTWVVDRAIGNDAFDCLTTSTPCQTWGHAYVLATAAGGTNKIRVKGDATCYNRTTGPAGTGATGSPTTDTAIVAFGGTDVCVTTQDTGFALSADATFTSTYSATVSNVSTVVDALAQPDRFGHQPRLTFVATPAIANSIPNTWACSGVTTQVAAETGSCGTVYVHRADGAAPTITNTHLLRPTAANFLLSSNVNLYIGSEDGTAFNFEGGGSLSVGGGAVQIKPTALGSTRHIVVVTNTTARYAFHGFGVESFHGYVLLSGVEGGGGVDDVYNPHNQLFSSAANQLVVCVNCTGENNGATGHTSVNTFTNHENGALILLGGYGTMSSGGMFRSINTSVNVAFGTTLNVDRGDCINVPVVNCVRPTLIQADNTANFYLDGVRLQGGAGQIGINNNGSGTVAYKNMQPFQMRTIGTLTAGW